MQKGKWLGMGLLAAAIYGGYKVWNINKSIDYFQYSIKGLKFNLGNILNPEVLFTISVYNPNRTTVPVNDVFGVVKIKDTVLANFKNTAPLNISGQETKDISIRARLSAFSIISSLIHKQSFLQVNIEGMIKTGLFDLPLSQSINFKST